MIEIPGIKLTEIIFQNNRTLVYRGIREIDHLPVILKILNLDQSSMIDVLRLSTEYDRLKNLKPERIIRCYDYFNLNGFQILVLEDIGGNSLKKTISSGISDIGHFLFVAMEITKAISEVHENKIIHQDIKPGNIIFNEKKNILKLTDFSISKTWNETLPAIVYERISTIGTPAYLSPEQSGWLNRSVDFRSDYYSLGVTLYELLTGELPFQSNDILELIHLHIASTPQSPDLINPNIPHTVSSIILKLMAKNAIDRYQSTSGLLADLEKCYRQWNESGKIDNFTPGEFDRNSFFKVSQNLYGRDDNINSIIKMYDIVSHGNTGLLCITGEFGTGKSSLVKELRSFFITQGCIFVSTKFEPNKSEYPYFGFTEIINALINRILTSSPDELNRWRIKIQKNLGNSVNIVTSIAPRLSLITGDLKKTEGNTYSESPIHINYILSSFIQMFSVEKKRLVIFLDNLNYADQSSLNLIQHMLSHAGVRGIFLITAFSKNLWPDYPLFQEQTELTKSPHSFNKQEKLEPLNIQQTCQMIVDTFRVDSPECHALAEIIQEKTGGIPYYICLFLENLYEDHLIHFNLNILKWEWDLEKIRRTESSPIESNLFIQKFINIPEEVLKILKVAVCIGRKFSISQLKSITGLTFEQVHGLVYIAVQNGILSLDLRDAESHTLTSIKNIETLDYACYFSGDILYHYLFNSISASEKQNIHYSIAKSFYLDITKNYPEIIENAIKDYCTNRSINTTLNDIIYDIVLHFNLSQNFIKDKEEKIVYAHLNSLAGYKARWSSSFASSELYFKNAARYYPKNLLSGHPGLFIKHKLDYSESLYLAGKFRLAEKHIQATLPFINNPIEKARFLRILIVQYTNEKKWDKAIDIGLKSLKLLQTDLTHITPKSLANFDKINLFFKKHSLNSLDRYKKMTDPVHIEAMMTMIDMVSPVYSVRPWLNPHLIYTMIQKSLDFGLNENTPYALMTFAILMGPGKGYYTRSHEMGRFALLLSDKLKGKKIQCRNRVSFAFNINHWKMPLETGFPILNKAYDSGLETGDLLWSGYSLVALIKSKYQKGNPVHEILLEADDYANFIEQSKNPILPIFVITRQCIKNLMGQTSQTTTLDSEDFNEKKYFKNVISKSSPHSIHWYHLCKMQIYYLYKDYKNAFLHIQGSEENLKGSLGAFSVSQHYYIESLILAALYETSAKEKQKSYLIRIEENIKRFKVWSENCPENFYHNYMSLKAEMARIKNEDTGTILNLYDTAISTAGKNNFPQDQAMISECAADYFKKLNKKQISHIYTRKALVAYFKWGALKKFEMINERFPNSMDTNRSELDFSLHGTHSQSATRELDFMSLLKFSQSISEEIDLSKLLNKVMYVLIENTGAQNGFLLLNRDNELVVEGEAHLKKNKILTGKTSSIKSDELMCMNMINYVHSTLETIIINSLEENNIWQTDPFVLKYRPRSILCMPIMKQTTFMGILYLDNRIAEDVFTPDKIKLLRILSLQSIIFIENSLYIEKINNMNLNLQNEIIDRVEKEEQLRYDSLHDSLTQLPNWTLFMDRLQNAINRSHRSTQYNFAVLLLDIDRFKVINDSLGHNIGNKLLIILSNIFQKNLRQEDTIARLGGDEFAILLEPVENISNVIRVVKELQNIAKNPVNIDGHELFTSLSIGIVLGKGEKDLPENVLRDADTALHRAKINGRDRYEIFDSAMHTQAIHFLQTERDLRRAIENNEIVLYGQPFYSLEENKISGFEALVRWNHPQRGLIFPGDFISIAETSLLINPLGDDIMHKACVFNKMIQAQDIAHIPVAINVSPIQFKDEKFIENVRYCLKHTELAPDFMELEITEGCIIENIQRAIDILNELKGLGIRFSIDDFGTGYSSLAYLNKLPVNKLKIDKSFIDNIAQNKDEASISKTIIALAKILEKKVIAEGVETVEQMDFLKINGCHEIQGYYFSKPLPLNQLINFMISHKY